MKACLLVFPILMGFSFSSQALLCRDALSSSSTKAIALNRKTPSDSPKYSDLTLAVFNEHLRLHQAYEDWAASAAKVTATKKVMDNKKLLLNWKDLFVIRHVFFRSRTESKDYKLAVKEYRTALEQEKSNAKVLAKLKESNQHDRSGTSLKDIATRKYLTSLAWGTLKDHLILSEGEQISFLELIHITKPEFEVSQPFVPGNLPVQQIQMAVAAGLGNSRLHYMIEFHYSPKNDRILKIGLVENGAFQNSSGRPYDRLLAGSVYEAGSGLRKIADHGPLQKFIKNKNLKLSLSQIRRIQLRTFNHRALRNQVNTVVSVANSSRNAPTQDLLQSYLSYWAFDGAPFSIAMMPPTHWFLFNMTLGHHGQGSVAHVLADVTTQLNQGKVLEQSDIQKRLENELEVGDRSPIILQTPEVGVEWDRHMNSLTHGLNDEAAAQVGKAIESSVDVESLAKSNEDLGLDPSTTSLVENDSGSNQNYDDSPGYSSSESSSSDSSSYGE